MKLRNKKTGEIADLSEGFIKDTYNGEMIQIKPVAISNKEGYLYGSLAELNAEWEDAPEEHWTIGHDGAIFKLSEWENENDHEEIGNYFETKEEAEKAVEKLKAWKRLKDAGFEFKGWKVLDHDSPRIYFNVYRKNSDDIVPFLDLLFGGKNESTML